MAATFDWVMDPELRRLFLLSGEPTWERHEAYWRGTLADPTQRVFAILANGRHVGNCGLKHISPSGWPEMWIYVGESRMRGLGIGRQAGEHLLAHASSALVISRVCVHVADFNLVASKLFERLGFHPVPTDVDAAAWRGLGCTVVRMERSERMEPLVQPDEPSRVE